MTDMAEYALTVCLLELGRVVRCTLYFEQIVYVL